MTNIQKISEALPSEKDCAMISSDINRRYFSGMKSSAGIVLIFKSAAYLLIDFRYYEKACATVYSCEVIELKSRVKQITELMKKHGADNILIEADTVTVAELDAMQRELSEFSIDSSGALSRKISELRSVKSNEELKKMQAAQDIADAAFDYVTENVIAEGVSERELALELDSFMLRMGAEAISFETIALCGENTSLPHGVPSERRIQRGEFVLMDYGAVCEGYHSDMTRTVCVGQPSDEMREVYGIVLEAQKRCLENAKSGISCKQLDAIARNFITEKGFGDNFGHGLGHSVGLEIHESPAANTRDETILRENMIMTVEPGIYLPKKFGIRIEDCICITASGYNNFVHSPKNLVIL